MLGPKWVSTIIDILNNYYNWSKKYPYEALPQPVSPCVLGLCFITFKRVWVIVPNMTLYLLFGPFLSYEMGGDTRVILGVLPSNPHITLATSWDVFGVPTCWGLSGFQQSYTSQMYRIRAITTKTNYFHTFWLIWPCCDLEMTLTWPWGNTFMKSYPSPCHHVYLGSASYWSKHDNVGPMCYLICSCLIRKGVI